MELYSTVQQKILKPRGVKLAKGSLTACVALGLPLNPITQDLSLGITFCLTLTVLIYLYVNV